MNKRLLVSALALLFVAALSLAQEKGKEGSWTGWITDTHCGAKGNNAKHTDCATKCVEQKNAKFALYTPEDKKIYILEPQDKVAEHAGHRVIVNGKITSIQMAPEATGGGQ